MSLLTYPSTNFVNPGNGFIPGLGFNFVWSPVWMNQTQKAVNGASIDITLNPYPLYNFELNYELLRSRPISSTYNGTPYSAADYELRRVMGFYNAMRGSAGRFYFDNPEDDEVFAQAVGTGDGTTTTFVLMRTFGDTSTQPGAGTQPIGQLLATGGPNSPVVYLNGVAQPGSAYTFTTTTPGNILLVFASAPGATVAITIDMQYLYYCKFADDTQPFEKFSNGRLQAMSLKLQSCVAGS